MADLIEQIKLVQAGIGPKRVKTPDVEVEQFSMGELIRAAAYTGTRRGISLGTIQFTIAVAKCGCSCATDETC